MPKNAVYANNLKGFERQPWEDSADLFNHYIVAVSSKVNFFGYYFSHSIVFYCIPDLRSNINNYLIIYIIHLLLYLLKFNNSFSSVNVVFVFRFISAVIVTNLNV